VLNDSYFLKFDAKLCRISYVSFSPSVFLPSLRA